MKGDLIRGHLNNLILAVLAAGPAHGYAVMQAIHEQSDGNIDLPEGSIYPALYRLERQGLIASDKVEHEGRERRVYHLTRRGRLELDEARLDWLSFTTAVEAILKPRMGGDSHAAIIIGY